MDFNLLIEDARRDMCSDVHITVGVPPKMRVRGALMDMDFPRLLPVDTDILVKGMMNEAQIDILNEKGEVEWPAYVVNYTMKTQYIARIQKNLVDRLYDSKEINKKY